MAEKEKGSAEAKPGDRLVRLASQINERLSKHGYDVKLGDLIAEYAEEAARLYRQNARIK